MYMMPLFCTSYRHSVTIILHPCFNCKVPTRATGGKWKRKAEKGNGRHWLLIWCAWGISSCQRRIFWHFTTILMPNITCRQRFAPCACSLGNYSKLTALHTQRTWQLSGIPPYVVESPTLSSRSSPSSCSIRKAVSKTMMPALLYNFASLVPRPQCSQI